jgi:hypothetical protein
MNAPLIAPDQLDQFIDKLTDICGIEHWGALMSIKRRNSINDQWSARRREMMESPAYRALLNQHTALSLVLS